MAAVPPATGAPEVHEPEFRIVERVRALPVVGKTLDAVAEKFDAYCLQSRIPIIKSTATAAGELLRSQRERLSKVDSAACAGLDRVEEFVSSSSTELQAQQQQLSTALRTAIANGRDQVTERISTTVAGGRAALAERTTSTVARITTSYDQASTRLRDSACGLEHRVASFSQAAMDAVEARLPEDEADDEAEAEAEQHGMPAAAEKEAEAEARNDGTLGAETRTTFARFRKLTTKARARALKRALSGLQYARLRSSEMVQQHAPFCVDLLQYARDHLDNVASAPVVLQAQETAASVRESCHALIEASRTSARRALEVASQQVAQWVAFMYQFLAVVSFGAFGAQPAGDTDTPRADTVPIVSRDGNPETITPEFELLERHAFPDGDADGDDGALEQPMAVIAEPVAAAEGLVQRRNKQKRPVNWYLGAADSSPRA